ncbi:hypothetical protein SDC9_188113 [bioreactor metagenome]|uniref:Uncharacterized protein n=1 Tax=bioreactor metagenome TaxID=1076179 RepID=A0A645HNE4_9ZZZZ
MVLRATSAASDSGTPSTPVAPGAADTSANAVSTVRRAAVSPGKDSPARSGGAPWVRAVLVSDGGSRISTGPACQRRRLPTDGVRSPGPRPTVSRSFGLRGGHPVARRPAGSRLVWGHEQQPARAVSLPLGTRDAGVRPGAR